MSKISVKGFVVYQERVSVKFQSADSTAKWTASIIVGMTCISGYIPYI